MILLLCTHLCPPHTRGETSPRCGAHQFKVGSPKRKSRSRVEASSEYTKTKPPEARAPGGLKKYAWQCPTFTWETPHYHRRYGDSGAEIPPLSCNHRLPCGIWHAESLVRWCERSILDANDQIIISVLKGCSSTNLVKTSHLSVCLDTPGMAYTSMKWSHRFLQRQKPFLYRK